MKTYTMIAGEMYENITIERIDYQREDVAVNRADKIAAIRAINPEAAMKRIPVQGRGRVVGILFNLTPGQIDFLRGNGVSVSAMTNMVAVPQNRDGLYFAIC